MRWPQNPGSAVVLPTGHSVCPRCGLRLQVADLGEQPGLRYDFADWDRVCRAPVLGGPASCLEMQRRARARDAAPGRH